MEAVLIRIGVRRALSGVRPKVSDPLFAMLGHMLMQSTDPSGGMPFTPCDAADFTFACNVNASACRDANPPFYVPK